MEYEEKEKLAEIYARRAVLCVRVALVSAISLCAVLAAVAVLFVLLKLGFLSKAGSLIGFAVCVGVLVLGIAAAVTAYVKGKIYLKKLQELDQPR